MFQGTAPPSEKQAEWSIHRDSRQIHSGLFVQSEPLTCIHTHWISNGPSTDLITQQFNQFILSKLKLLKRQSKVQNLLAILAEKQIR